MFIAAYTFLPILCAYSIVFAKSLSSTSALLLKDKLPVPQYTASAPYINAVFAFSNDPAGANNSGFFILFYFLSLFSSIYHQNIHLFLLNFQNFSA